MEYINYIKSKARLATASKSDTPVLSEEDEQFLDHITSQENPPPLPARPVLTIPEIRDAQVALMDGADNIPLPATPNEVTKELVAEPDSEATATDDASPNKPKATWSWLRRDSREVRVQQREDTASGLDAIAANLRKAEAEDSDDTKEAQREEEDMTVVLERLNLAAVNNRVFSISDDTQELLEKFNLVFKDLINGVPTAYDDLESLLTNGDRQLQRRSTPSPAFSRS